VTAALTDEQRRVLTELNEVLNKATNNGLLDVLVADCKNPDSLNDFCDAVTYADRNYN
jgi:hypothetical protein